MDPCKHGARPGWWWKEAEEQAGPRGFGWAGGLTKCKCCRTEFGYLGGPPEYCAKCYPDETHFDRLEREGYRWDGKEWVKG